MELASLLKLYDYKLSPELVAQAPAKPRDAARLLVYSKRDGKINFDRFLNLSKYLPKNAVLVFNQTKVWPARLKVQKPGGGKAELLYISHDKSLIKVLSNKKLGANSLVALLLGRAIVQQMKIVKKVGAFYFLKPSFPMSRLSIILKKYGCTPLPPYIKYSPLSEKKLREQYQSVFAKTGLSVAAPTASLHFTKRLIRRLQKQGIGTAFIQLDVNLGTFAPLREEQIKSGKLHREFYNIDKKTARFLNFAKQKGRPIIAVGTTVVRTLESACSPSPLARGEVPNASDLFDITQGHPEHSRMGEGQRGRNFYSPLIQLQGQTDLFIQENYKFKFVDGLITNFHVPKSSLLMLTSAFIGRKKLLNLYQLAINQNFRFFSFGDGMLILPLK